MPCKTCAHPRRSDIDRALLDGQATLAQIGRQYGLSPSSLHRHKQDLLDKISQARTRLQNNLRQDCLFQLSSFLAVIQQTVQAAAAQEDHRLVLQAVRAGARLVQQITKLEVFLDRDAVYRLHESQQWLAQDSLLPTDPQFLAAGRQAAARSFFTPCSHADDQKARALPPSPADLNLSSSLDRLLTSLNLDPDLLPGAKPAPREIASPPAAPDRKKAGIKPKNSSRQKDKQKINQIDKKNVKKFRSCPLPAPAPVPAPPAAAPPPPEPSPPPDAAHPGRPPVLDPLSAPISDRQWQEDYGNPRKFLGTY